MDRYKTLENAIKSNISIDMNPSALVFPQSFGEAGCGTPGRRRFAVSAMT